MCEKKRRYLDADLKHVKMAFYVYHRFYQIHYKSVKQRSYDDFAKSNHYIAFVKFGRYLEQINAVNPSEFVDFLIKNAIPIDDWTTTVVYEVYLRELAKKETPDAAVERNILLMQQWALGTGDHWTDFFRKVATPYAVLMIRNGRLSPWVLFTAASAADLIARFTPEQHALIRDYVDPAFWEVKLEQHAEEVITIGRILEEAGL